MQTWVLEQELGDGREAGEEEPGEEKAGEYREAWELNTWNVQSDMESSTTSEHY